MFLDVFPNSDEIRESNLAVTNGKSSSLAICLAMVVFRGRVIQQ